MEERRVMQAAGRRGRLRVVPLRCPYPVPSRVLPSTAGREEFSGHPDASKRRRLPAGTLPPSPYLMPGFGSPPGRANSLRSRDGSAGEALGGFPTGFRLKPAVRR